MILRAMTERAVALKAETLICREQFRGAAIAVNGSDGQTVRRLDLSFADVVSDVELS